MSAVGDMGLIDFRNPDYTPVFRERLDRLVILRSDPDLLAAAWSYYRAEDDPAALGDRVADFIEHWGVTLDPRNIERDRPALVPFLLFPKQREWVRYVVRKWREQKPGITEKSRDMGISWLSVATSCALCLLLNDMAIGFGSRKEEYVDKLGSPKSLFYKARAFMRGLPPEFRPGWDESKHAPHMRIEFPGTGSVITGEAGDNIGRGDRSAIYFVDEEAFLERPMLVEASLSQTTNCRMSISTPNGRGNPFAQKRFSGKIEVFTFHWRDDPRKDDAWYAKQLEELDAVTIAQEIDLNYDASATGILIPAAWVQAAVNADHKLGLTFTGRRQGALDVADEGVDLNAYSAREGVKLRDVQEWSGKESDIFGTVQRAFGLADGLGISDWWYDADGLGAGVRGDARVINETREAAGNKPQRVEPFRGSGAVYRPDASIPTAQPGAGGNDSRDRKNKDFFLNAKAQGWWDLRVRFQRTFRAVEAVAAGGVNPYDPDDLICLDGEMPCLGKLCGELSQPTYSINTAGKLAVDKAPEGTKSPNLGDAVMINYAPRRRSFLDYLG